MRFASHLLAPTLLLVAGCAAFPPRDEPATPAPVFAPSTFFGGRTVGDGVLRVLLSRPRAVHVVGDGHAAADGTLVIVQHIREGDRAPRSRTWTLRPLGDGRYAGTLDDATGPVLADVRGNRLHVRYRAKGALSVEQWLYLRPGGDTALNLMTVRKFGLPAATLRETIRRVP